MAKIVRKINEYKAFGLKIPPVLEKNCIPLDISIYIEENTKLIYQNLHARNPATSNLEAGRFVAIS
jgi:hypothetical protein